MPAALTTVWFILLAVAAGVSIASQQVINAGLPNAVNSAWWAGFISDVGGTLFMLVALLATRESLPGGLTALMLCLLFIRHRNRNGGHVATAA
jgi:transporter family-2 protein